MENVDTRYAAFGEINQLIEEAERQYGVGNLNILLKGCNIQYLCVLNCWKT